MSPNIISIYLFSSNVGKAITLFDCFQFEFSQKAVLGIKTVVLNAKFNSLSNDIIFNLGYRQQKNSVPWKILDPAYAIVLEKK